MATSFFCSNLSDSMDQRLVYELTDIKKKRTYTVHREMTLIKSCGSARASNPGYSARHRLGGDDAQSI